MKKDKDIADKINQLNELPDDVLVKKSS